jgi:hypothetical protein
MRERAEEIGAELRLFSRPGGGTELALGVPGTIAYQRLSEKTWTNSLVNLFSISFPVQKGKNK